MSANTNSVQLVSLLQCTAILQSAAEFSNVVPWNILFSESPNKSVYKFLICNYEYGMA